MKKDRVNFFWFLLAGIVVVLIATLHPLTMIQTVSFVLLAGFFFYLSYESFRFDKEGREYGYNTDGVRMHPTVGKLIRSAAMMIPSIFLLYLLAFFGMTMAFQPSPLSNMMAKEFSRLELRLFGFDAFSRLSNQFSTNLYKDALAKEKAGQTEAAIDSLKFLNEYRYATYRTPSLTVDAAIGGLYDKLGRYQDADKYYEKVERPYNRCSHSKKYGTCEECKEVSPPHYYICTNRLRRLLSLTTPEDTEMLLNGGSAMKERLEGKSVLDGGAGMLPVSTFILALDMQEYDAGPMNIDNVTDQLMPVDQIGRLIKGLSKTELHKLFPRADWKTYQKYLQIKEQRSKYVPKGASLYPRSLYELPIDYCAIVSMDQKEKLLERGGR